MPTAEGEKPQEFRSCYHGGRYVDVSQAVLPVQSLALRYALSVFEGIRLYQVAEGGKVAAFRLAEHCRRLRRSADLMEMETDTPERLPEILRQLIEVNGVRSDSYVRAAVSAGASGTIGIADRSTISTVIVSPMGRKRWLANDEALKVGISRTQRPDEAVLSAQVKNISQYAGSRVALLRAKREGYDMILHLNARGFLSEAPAAAAMFVIDGTLCTPPLSDGILASITRAVLLEVARDLGISVAERSLTPADALGSSEAFLCGTGIEVAPIGSIDGHPIGEGRAGPLTRRLVQEYFTRVRQPGGDR